MVTRMNDDALLIAPDAQAPGLTRKIRGTDHTGAETEIPVVEERPLTIFLNSQEIVTAMTIGDYPEYLALGFLPVDRKSPMKRITVAAIKSAPKIGAHGKLAAGIIWWTAQINP